MTPLRVILLGVMLGGAAFACRRVPSDARTTPAGTSEASEGGVSSKVVGFANGGSGWLEVPRAEGKRAALLVVPEWWGMNDWIKQDAARFASRGYVALAIDLYRGHVAADPAEAHELMRGLSEDRAMEDMKAAFEWLSSRSDVDPQRIGIVGWCMGGGYALAFAAAEPRLRAAAVNYGKLVTAPERIRAIHAVLLGNFAGQDRGISPEDVHAFEDRLKTEHKDADIKVYPGAKHAFMNPNNKDAYDQAAAQDAWQRIDAFFGRALRGN